MRRACDLCLKRKRKCVSDGKGSCSMCKAKGKLCTFTPQICSKSRSKRITKIEDYDRMNKTSQNACIHESNEYPIVDSKSELMLTSPASMPRLRPSQVTGFLGMRENSFFQSFFWANVAKIPINSLQGAVVNTMQSMGNNQHKNSIIAASSNGCMWIGLALGATIQHRVDKLTLQFYMNQAHQAMRGFSTIPSAEILKVHLLKAELFAYLQDYPRFIKSFEMAMKLAKMIANLNMSRDRSNDRYGHVVENAAPLDEDLWFQMEAFGVLYQIVVKEIKYNNRSSELVEKLFSLSNIGQPIDRNIDAEPGVAMAAFFPVIEGMPTFHPDTISNLLSRGGYFSESKVKTLSRSNMVSSVLTALSDPETLCVSSLINSVTKGKSFIFPIVTSLHHRAVHLMKMVVVTEDLGPGTIIYEAGIRLRRIFERIYEAFGDAYWQHPGINQMCMISDLAFTRLFTNDEEGCLTLLLMLHRMICEGPGMIRFPYWSHPVQWISALLLSANRMSEHQDIVKYFNAVSIDTNVSHRLPEEYFEKKALFQCRQFQCQGVLCVLNKNILTGRAALFVHHLPLLASHYQPSYSISDKVTLTLMQQKGCHEIEQEGLSQLVPPQAETEYDRWSRNAVVGAPMFSGDDDLIADNPEDREFMYSMFAEILKENSSSSMGSEDNSTGQRH